MSNTWLAKSWLFEVVEADTHQVVESFTLLLPPESVSVKEGQRVSISKTFGASFVDDYGPDNITLTIRGFSGTAQAFPTFRTNGAAPGSFSNISVNPDETQSQGYDQKAAFIIFRDSIMRYKDNAGFETKRLYVYNLNDEEAYECTLLDFTLDRTSSAPTRYPFSIQLFVVEDLLGPKMPSATPLFSDMSLSAYTKSMDNLDQQFDWIQATLKFATDIRSSIVKCRQYASDFRARTSGLANAALNIANTPLFLLEQIVDELTAINISANSLYKSGKLSMDNYANVMSYITAARNSNLKLWGVALQSDKTDAQKIEGPSRSVSTLIAPNTTDGTTSKPAPSSGLLGDVQTLAASGFVAYTVKGTDTLQSLAQKYLGDASLWPFIAQLNGILSSDQVISGTTISMPVVAQSGQNAYIIQRNALDNPFGNDIQLDGTGKLVVQGDVLLVGGEANVLQALNNMLSTKVGSVIRHTAYGIRARVGIAGTGLVVSYMAMSVKASLLLDPRIKSVDDVNFEYKDDRTYLSYKATLRYTALSVGAYIVL